jgi:hypothetical protein
MTGKQESVIIVILKNNFMDTRLEIEIYSATFALYVRVDNIIFLF